MASTWGQPLSGAMNVTSNWGVDRGDHMHAGTDFGVAIGTQVHSVYDGKVVQVGFDKGGYGNYVKVQHPSGVYSFYAHLSSQTVSVGQTVSGGSIVGLSGNTGRSSGPHLHFEIRTGSGSNKETVDPLKYLKGYPSPVRGATPQPGEVDVTYVDKRDPAKELEDPYYTKEGKPTAATGVGVYSGYGPGGVATGKKARNTIDIIGAPTE